MRLLVVVFALALVCIPVAVTANGQTAPTPAPAEATSPTVTEPAEAGAGPTTEVETSTSTATESTTVETETSVSQPAGVGMGTAMQTNELADNCFMSCFNISRQQLSDLQSQGFTYADIAMASAIATRSNCPLDQVVQNYKTSRDWNTVAAKYNLSMSDLRMMSMPVMASADEESFNRMFISQYYGISEADISQLRRQGYSWSSINMMANASVRTNQPIAQIASLRSQGMSWSDIATRYNVASSDLMMPVRLRTVATVGLPPGRFGAGPMTMPRVMYDRAGNVMLTDDQVYRLYAKGYDWLDVAVAANLSRETGIPIEQVLTDVRSMGSWMAVVNSYGVSHHTAFDVSAYPFERKSIYSQSQNERNLRQIEKYQSQPVLGPTPVTPMTNPSGTMTPTPMP